MTEDLKWDQFFFQRGKIFSKTGNSSRKEWHKISNVQHDNINITQPIVYGYNYNINTYACTSVMVV